MTKPHKTGFHGFPPFTLAAALGILLAIAASPLLAGNSDKPNIIIILADDLGFSDIGCYGGEIETPNLDRLADDGLRYTQFYNTARCWPTRACILTGYYAQQVNMDPPRGKMPSWSKVFPHHLKPLGYRAYHSGKWHLRNTPKAVAQGGFDHSFIIHDHDRFFYPKRSEQDDQPLPPVERGTDYYLTSAIADHAIGCLDEHQEQHAAKPFVLYLAFTCPHFPLHALPEDIDRYRQRYKVGWDVIRRERYERIRKMGITDCELSKPEPTTVARWSHSPERLINDIDPGEGVTAVPWDSLNDAQKDYQATKMAIHAAMVDRMDRDIGRVLEQVRAMKALDNTAVFFLSDNGASAEQIIRGDMHDKQAPLGSGGSYLCLGPGWSTAANTPFRRHKHWTHEGGCATPLIVHWPRGIKTPGKLRNRIGHVIDLVPTVLELAGAPLPEPTDGPPLPGQSLVPSFTTVDEPGHDVLFFHHAGNRAVRQGDWKLVSSPTDGDRWELFNLSTDRAEQNDLTAEHPDRVRQMEALWHELEAKYRAQASGDTQ